MSNPPPKNISLQVQKFPLTLSHLFSPSLFHPVSLRIQVHNGRLHFLSNILWGLKVHSMSECTVSPIRPRPVTPVRMLVKKIIIMKNQTSYWGMLFLILEMSLDPSIMSNVNVFQVEECKFIFSRSRSFFFCAVRIFFHYDGIIHPSFFPFFH